MDILVSLSRESTLHRPPWPTNHKLRAMEMMKPIPCPRASAYNNYCGCVVSLSTTLSLLKCQPMINTVDPCLFEPRLSEPSRNSWFKVQETTITSSLLIISAHAMYTFMTAP